MVYKLTLEIPLSAYLHAWQGVDELNNYIIKHKLAGYGYLNQTLVDKGCIEIIFSFTNEQDAVSFYMYWHGRFGTNWQFSKAV